MKTMLFSYKGTAAGLKEALRQAIAAYEASQKAA